MRLSADFDAAAFGIASDYVQKLTDTLFVTVNYVISSSSDTVLYNVLALNVAMTDKLALRASILTEYHSDLMVGARSTDNTFRVSLVCSFN